MILSVKSMREPDTKLTVCRNAPEINAMNITEIGPSISKNLHISLSRIAIIAFRIL